MLWAGYFCLVKIYLKIASPFDFNQLFFYAVQSAPAVYETDIENQLFCWLNHTYRTEMGIRIPIHLKNMKRYDTNTLPAVYGTPSVRQKSKRQRVITQKHTNAQVVTSSM